MRPEAGARATRSSNLKTDRWSDRYNNCAAANRITLAAVSDASRAIRGDGRVGHLHRAGSVATHQRNARGQVDTRQRLLHGRRLVPGSAGGHRTGLLELPPKQASQAASGQRARTRSRRRTWHHSGLPARASGTGRRRPGRRDRGFESPRRESDGHHLCQRSYSDLLDPGKSRLRRAF